MSEQIVAALVSRSTGQMDVMVERQYRVRYEVWTNDTLVLRTIHQTQAIRYATEVHGEVHTIQQNGFY